MFENVQGNESQTGYKYVHVVHMLMHALHNILYFLFDPTANGGFSERETEPTIGLLKIVYL